MIDKKICSEIFEEGGLRFEKKFDRARMKNLTFDDKIWNKLRQTGTN